MDYSQFYDIAVFGNENWKGNFTPREIADNAYTYKVEYDLSIEQGKPTRTMIELCKLIVEDMDWLDYVENPYGNEETLDIFTMRNIIEDFAMEV